MPFPTPIRRTRPAAGTAAGAGSVARMPVAPPSPADGLWARWRGWWEVLLFAALTVAYEVARWAVRPQGDDAIARAHDHTGLVIDAEKAIGLYVEGDVQRLTHDLPGGEWFTTQWYSYAHTPGFILFFVAVWWLRRRWYPFVRNAFWIGHAIAVLVFWVFPMAPPRLADIGLSDPTNEALKAGGALDWFQQFRNEYAAMPSLHMGYTFFFALVLWLLLRGHRWRWVVWLWPATLVWVTMATANHFWLDGVGGAAVMGTALAVAAALLPRAMPRTWAYRPRNEDAP